MRRGDVVTVAAAGDYGKPRPAVIVRSDAFPDFHESVVVCQMTSQIMADKPVTIRRARMGRAIGRLNVEEITRLNAALAFVMGLAD